MNYLAKEDGVYWFQLVRLLIVQNFMKAIGPKIEEYFPHTYIITVIGKYLPNIVGVLGKYIGK